MALQWSWAVVEMCSFKLSSSREPGGGDGDREIGTDIYEKMAGILFLINKNTKPN